VDLGVAGEIPKRRNTVFVPVEARLNLFGFVLENVVMRACSEGFQARWDAPPTLLQDVGEFVSQQLLSGIGVGFVASLPEINVATRGESMGVNVPGGICCRAVIVDPDIVKPVGETAFHHAAHVRPKGNTWSTAIERTAKSGGDCGQVSFALALKRFLITFLASAPAGASAGRHAGAAQDCSRSTAGQRSFRGALDSHITDGA
jgi:hypothetical protein